MAEARRPSSRPRPLVSGCREEDGVNINCYSRLPGFPISSFFFFRPVQPKALSPNTLSQCKTHTRTHTHVCVRAYIPNGRDGSVTIGKQRLLVTENALRLEAGQPSAGERKWWDYTGAAAGRERRAASCGPQRSKLSRFTSEGPHPPLTPSRECTPTHPSHPLSRHRNPRQLLI